MTKYIFRKAEFKDLEDIRLLYKLIKGSIYCPWNEYYPNEENLFADFNSDNLFVLNVDEKLIGVISINPENELDVLNIWENIKCLEFARFAISPLYQGMGYGTIIIKEIEKIILQRGYSSIHILVYVDNIPAIKLYDKLGYINKGKLYMYGRNYFAYEKLI